MRKISKIFIFLYLLNFSIYGESQVLTFGTKTKKIEFLKKVLNNKDKVYIKEVANFLDDEDKEVRTFASLILYEIGDSTCIDFYKKSLGDEYWQIRLYGIKGLVKFGEGDILENLFASLDDPYWQVRYYAAIGIGKYGDENSISNLISHLNETNLEVKKAILISLKRLLWKNITRFNFKSMDENQLKLLFDCFESNDEQIKLLTISIFESVKDVRSIPYLVKLLGDKSDEVKIKSLWALEGFKTKNIEEIEGLLNEPSVKVKIEAIKTLVRLKGEEGINGLIKGLSDENESVKIYSLWALEKFKNPASYPEIVKCIADKSLSVREEAINIIERTDDSIFIPILEKFIENKETNIEHKKLAIIELGKIGNLDLNRAKDILKKYLKSSDREIRYTSIEGFYYLDKFDDYYIKNLVYMEKNDPDIRIRKCSSRYLGEIIDECIIKINSMRESDRKFVIDKIDSFIGSNEINKLLIKMFYSKYPEVREKAVFVLKEMPRKVFAKNVKELAKESDVELKKLCAIVLGEMRDLSSIGILKQGLTHFDPEYQLICANSLAKMGRNDGINVIMKNINNDDVYYQKIAVESLIYLDKIAYSPIFIKKLHDSELDIKIISAWGLARLGNLTGLEVLVRLSEINVEPIRTLANIYLKDQKIPSNLRSKIPFIREEIYRNKLGVQEVSPKIMYSYKTDIPVEIDGKDDEGIWKMIEEINGFISIEDEKVFIDAQTKIASVYDNENIYFLIKCENPSNGVINFDTRDFLTISINPKNSFNEWYQFVFHPLKFTFPLSEEVRYLKYSYKWKFYKNEEDVDKLWNSDWKIDTDVSSPGTVRKWIAEIAIPIKDLKVEKIIKGTQWTINFQREINNYIISTWTGRIDIPDQFGLIIFKESP
ncbi:MAG TPA: HEAT repeat domain-containing protein [bacterium]|mgnify:CR=1 FL=1|nr:HEAT repeat domain-containing protein [bacterium]HOM25990.1 HEAT repeat domain-containing protein [bacterium]